MLVLAGMDTMRPDYSRNLGALLHGEAPDRPVLFEFYHNDALYRDIAGERADETSYAQAVRAFAALGYDHANLFPQNGFSFTSGTRHRDATVSLNEGAVITDRASFAAYVWPRVEAFDWSYLDRAATALAPGQVLMPSGPGGVLENVISLMGFERMCELLSDDPELVQDVFDGVGSALLAYYQRVIGHPGVGFLMSNDDWGFKTQTMLSPRQMRRLVFPWHERIVACAHAAGKQAVLHSCGNLAPIMDEVIDGLKYDGKHSYEDGIMRVEEAWERWGSRIAILGGLDVDYLCRTPAAQIEARSAAMLARTGGRGWAAGTGNSVPEWVPREAFFACIAPSLRGRSSGDHPA